MTGSSEFLGETMPESQMQHFALRGISTTLRWGRSLTDRTEVIDTLKQATAELEALNVTSDQPAEE